MNSVSRLSVCRHRQLPLAALTAVGIPPAGKPFVRVGDGNRGERTVWFFDPQSADGKSGPRS